MTLLATGVPRSRQIATSAPLEGGGNLGADRTLSLTADAVAVLTHARKRVNVIAYNADPTGATDSTAAFNSAIEAAYAAGYGEVVVPAGEYIIQGANLRQGVLIVGEWCYADYAIGTGPRMLSRLRLPVSPVAGVAMFRRPLGHNALGGSWAGGGILNCELDGRLFSGVLAIPSAPTSVVETEKLRGVDMRMGPLVAIASINTTSNMISCASPHGLTLGDPVCFDLAAGATMPTGISAQRAYYFAQPGSNPSVDLYLYDTYTHAIAGGPTGQIDISTSGSGTIYLSGSIEQIHDFRIENCFIHNFDEGFRGACLSDRVRFVYDLFWANYASLQAQEHPVIKECRIWYNDIGVTGRFADMHVDRSNNISLNNYGIAPYGGNAGGSAYRYNTDSAAGWYLNSSSVSCVLVNNKKAGATISSNCVMNDHRVQGTTTDTDSIGVRIQGTSNTLIGGFYGQGNDASSFGRCAVLLDKSASSDLSGTLIQGGNFNLTGGAAIAGGNSNLSTPLFGATAYGGLDRISLIGNTAKLSGQRFLDYRSTNGSITRARVLDNTVLFQTGGVSPIGASDGLIEAGIYTDSQVVGNSLYKLSGSVGYGIKAVTLSPRGWWHDNVIDGAVAFAAGMSFASVSAPTFDQLRIRNNKNFNTEATGLAAIPDGASSITISHGLALTPTLQQTIVTLIGLTNGPTAFKVGTVTSTQFTITANTAVTGGATLGSGSGANLTITAHGLQTGDPFVWTGGTVAASAPSTLVIGTVYYARRIDANTVQVHTTQAGAIGNTGNFTNLSGSGGTMGIVLAWRAGFNNW